jgi:hypothetical protein
MECPDATRRVGGLFSHFSKREKKKDLKTNFFPSKKSKNSIRFCSSALQSINLNTLSCNILGDHKTQHFFFSSFGYEIVFFTQLRG